jgi:hypothetical protein
MENLTKKKKNRKQVKIERDMEEKQTPPFFLAHPLFCEHWNWIYSALYPIFLLRLFFSDLVFALPLEYLLLSLQYVDDQETSLI